MSQKNVELVRAMCDAFVAGEFAPALDALDPDVEWRGTIGGLEEERHAHGRGEVMNAYVESQQAWETHELEWQRIFDAGDRVVVFWHETARGRVSQVEVATDTAVIYTVSDGSVVCVQPYMDRTAALESVGLAE